MPGAYIDANVCKGCGLCVKACPRDLIALSEHINKKGYNAAYCVDPTKCVGCALCYAMCPDCVIRVER